MKFYTKTQQYYCGIDLHTKTQYLCVLNQAGEIILHKNVSTKPQAFLKAIRPYREDLVVGVECMFSWYWLADLCAQEKIAFILGHALYMKAIHGGKAKSDKIDSEKIARLIKGGTFPLAYTYPSELRPSRDLLLRRRRMLVRHRSEVLAHIKQRTINTMPSSLKRTSTKRVIVSMSPNYSTIRPLPKSSIPEFITGCKQYLALERYWP